jgi:cyclase
MLKKRFIPVLLLRNGVIVQSRNFKRYQIIGTPTAAVERLSNWASDELIYLDISPEPIYDLNRNDLNHPSFSSILDIIQLIASKCFMPLTFGGGIRSLNDVYLRIENGADKISINTIAIDNPNFIAECAKIFGSQCIVISIDVMKIDNKWRVFKGGCEATDLDPVSWAHHVQENGAGEILLNSIDKDGTKAGFDVDLISRVSNSVSIPVIGMGGAGSYEHIREVLTTSASAVAAANMLHHTENSVFEIKNRLYDEGLNVRRPLPLSKAYKNL